MNTLFLFSHCGNHFLPPPFEGCVFNHPAVMSCLIWALVVIILSVIVSRYLKKLAQIKKEIAVAAQQHELAMKEKNFEQETFWYFQKNLKCDFKKELDDKIKKLENEKKELSEKLENEKKDRAKTLKEERLQAEHDFYERILKTFYNTDDSQQTNK